MNKVCMLMTWIWIQGATSRQQKTVTIVLKPNDKIINHHLVCKSTETIVIDGIFYYNFSNGNSCSVFAQECQPTLETQYIIHDLCSTKKGVCRIGANLSQIRDCKNSTGSADCIVIGYSCVQESQVVNMCSNSTIMFNSSYEVDENVTSFLYLDQTQDMNHSLCYCNITSATPFTLTGKDIRMYGPNRECSQSTIETSFLFKDRFPYWCLNDRPWPHYSWFHETASNLSMTEIIINSVIRRNYPAAVFKIIGKNRIDVICTTNGTVKPAQETTPFSENPTTISKIETSNWSTSKTSPTSSKNHGASASESKPDSTLLIFILTIVAGVVVVTLIAVVTAYYIHRRKRKRKPGIGLTTDFTEADNPYYISERYEAQEHPHNDTTRRQSGQCEKKSGVATRSRPSYVNTKELAHFVQDNSEISQMPMTTLSQDVDNVNYDCIQFQSIQAHLEDAKWPDIHTNNQMTNAEIHLDVDKKQSASKCYLDDTYNHLDDGLVKISESMEMNPYDHFGNQMTAFGTERFAGIDDFEETYNHLNGSSGVMGGFFTNITGDERDYLHVSLTNYRNENAFTPNVYSGVSSYENFSLDKNSTQQKALTVNTGANSARNQKEFGPGKKIIDDLDGSKYSACNKGDTPFMVETRFDTGGKQRFQNDDFGQFNPTKETLDHDYFILEAVAKTS